MKKILTVVLASALASAVSITAFADDTSERLNNYGNSSVKPQAVIVSAGEPDIKISADIVWDELTFVYKGDDKQWNPSTHRDDTVAGGWDPVKKNITVTNHSNTGIRADFSFAPSVDGIKGTFEGNIVMELDSAVNTEYENAPNGTVKFGISGTEITDTAAVKIGTLTVKVATQSGEPVYKNVATEAELRSALEDGNEYIRLTDSIYYQSSSELSVKQNCTLDMNGCTVTVMAMNNRALFNVSSPEYFCLKNGTVAFEDICQSVNPIELRSSCALYIENCTLNAKDSAILDIEKGSDAVIKDSIINYTYVKYPQKNALFVRKGSLTLGGKVDIKANAPIGKWDTGTVICLAGTYNLDPSEYVDKSTYDVTANGDSWTVSEK